MLENNRDPLISICIYNYNYGRYLTECLDSVVNQTYQNFEILFSDNGSDDNSWQIACEFQQNYPDKIHLARNIKNFGTDANLANCLAAVRGKYQLVLGSDDVLHPEFLETCVKAFVAHPDLMYVMVHRYILDQESNQSFEKPFYNGSYKLFPPSQNSVYMMAAINPSISQIMYRVGGIKLNVAGIFNGQFYSARLQDFIISLKHPVAYIDKALLGHRIHGDNQSLVANDNLMEIAGPFVLLHQFMDLAQPYDFPELHEKYNDGIVQLAKLSLRYAARALIGSRIRLFQQYLNMSRALYPEICEDSSFKVLEKYDGSNIEQVKSLIDGDMALAFGRVKSYPPNPPYERLTI